MVHFAEACGIGRDFDLKVVLALERILVDVTIALIDAVHRKNVSADRHVPAWFHIGRKSDEAAHPAIHDHIILDHLLDVLEHEGAGGAATVAMMNNVAADGEPMAGIIGKEHMRPAVPFERLVEIVEVVACPQIITPGPPAFYGTVVKAVAADAVDLVPDDSVSAGVKKVKVVLKGQLLPILVFGNAAPADAFVGNAIPGHLADFVAGDQIVAALVELDAAAGADKLAAIVDEIAFDAVALVDIRFRRILERPFADGPAVHVHAGETRVHDEVVLNHAVLRLFVEPDSRVAGGQQAAIPHREVFDILPEDHALLQGGGRHGILSGRKKIPAVAEVRTDDRDVF